MLDLLLMVTLLSEDHLLVELLSRVQPIMLIKELRVLTQPPGHLTIASPVMSRTHSRTLRASSRISVARCVMPARV